jgi:hypothetical protein
MDGPLALAGLGPGMGLEDGKEFASLTGPDGVDAVPPAMGRMALSGPEGR